MKTRVGVVLVMALCAASVGHADDVVLFRHHSLESVTPMAGEDAILMRFGSDVVAVISHGVHRGEFLAKSVSREKLRLVKDLRPTRERVGYKTLFQMSGWKLVQLTDVLVERSSEVSVRRIRTGMIVDAPEKKAAETDPLIQSFVESITTESYQDSLTQIANSTSTRFVCGDGISSARDLLATQFTAAGFDVEITPFDVECFACLQPQGENVIATRLGAGDPENFVVVGAHYDSISWMPCSNAPGANDNGSGTAGLLEIARVIADYDTDATVVIAAFSGEELGLVGSRTYVTDLIAQDHLQNIRGVVIMDMIAFWASRYSVILEGSDAAPEQWDAVTSLVELAGTYTTLGVTTTNEYWGSDHEPFLDAGVPGALVIEEDWDSYESYHTPQDTLDQQDSVYGRDVTRLVAAAVASWSGLRPLPTDDDTADDDGNDDFDDDETDDDSGDDATDEVLEHPTQTDRLDDENSSNEDHGCGCA